MSGGKSFFSGLLAVLGFVLLGSQAAPVQAYQYPVEVTGYYLYYNSNYMQPWVYKAGYYRSTSTCEVGTSAEAACASAALLAQFNKDLAEYNAMGSYTATQIGLLKPDWTKYSVGAYLKMADVNAGTVTPPTMVVFMGGMVTIDTGSGFGNWITSTTKMVTDKETQISTTAAARTGAVAYSSAADSAGSAAPCVGGTQWFGTWSGCQPGMTMPARNVVRTLDDGDRPVQITPTIPSLPTR